MKRTFITQAFIESFDQCIGGAGAEALDQFAGGEKLHHDGQYADGEIDLREDGDAFARVVGERSDDAL